MSMFEMLILIAVAIWWFAERASVRRRLDSIEQELQSLRRRQESAAPVVRPLAQRSAEPDVPRTEPRAEPRTAAATTTPAVPRDTVSATGTSGWSRAAERATGPVASAESASAASASTESPWITTSAPESNGSVAMDKVTAAVKGFFTGGNLIVRVGIIILFFGVAFLRRYAAEHTHLSIEWRLSGIGVGALLLLALGWRWRNTRRNYALALQGGGVGVLYLTVFAALRLYGLLSHGTAFAALAVVAALSAALAIMQNSLAFAMIGAIGGFLAPLLVSTGSGNFIALFSHYALLDLAIVAIAWFRSWRPLNLLAFLFTFGIGTSWGVLRYEPQNLATTEPFLILFFVMFVAIAVIFAMRQAPKLTNYVDGTLVFGVPVVTIALQSGLVHRIPYAMAYSALALSALYLALAWWLHKRQREGLKLLVESFLALGVAFATLAVPFALDGRWTAATWALEGAAALWIGWRQSRRLAVVAGLLLQLAGGMAYSSTTAIASGAASTLAVFNSQYLVAVLISVAGVLSGLNLRRAGPPWANVWRAPASNLLFA